MTAAIVRIVPSRLEYRAQPVLVVQARTLAHRDMDGETVMAEKFSITDPWSEFFAWVSPNGRMLRLTLPAVGLRVDRDPASLKGSPLARTVPPVLPGIPTVMMQLDPKISPQPPAAPAKPKPDATPGTPGH